MVTGEQQVVLSNRLLAQRLPGQPLSELVLLTHHMTMGRADHHAVKLDGQRHLVLSGVGERHVVEPPLRRRP